MKKTRVCDMLGIEYPIFQGGMAWISDASLAGAVSNAGGLGLSLIHILFFALFLYAEK